MNITSFHFYHKVLQFFVKKYVNIVSPLIALLKKNDLSWNDAIDQPLQDLKNAMCTTLIISLSDFTETFLLECDASGS
jgi:hypothetical protein